MIDFEKRIWISDICLNSKKREFVVISAYCKKSTGNVVYKRFVHRKKRDGYKPFVYFERKKIYIKE